MLYKFNNQCFTIHQKPSDSTRLEVEFGKVAEQKLFRMVNSDSATPEFGFGPDISRTANLSSKIPTPIIFLTHS